jgi:hypothetical protein
MTIEQITALDYWMIIPLFLLGSALHFTYNWSKHNKSVAIISAVNESYWEHIKIAFWPVFLLYVVEFVLGGYNISSFIPAKTIALYTIPISMVAIVFGYKHFAKKNILAIDISAFLITIAISQVACSLLMRQLSADFITIIISLCFLVFIIIAFLVSTRHSPKETDLFKDPITSKYGLRGHK